MVQQRQRQIDCPNQAIKTKACLKCSAFALCTKNKEGRQIERSEHQAYIDQNRLNIAANPKVYKRRQAIVAHPYGIVKRQRGFYFITTKRSMKRASDDVGLMFVAFNVRRLMNIIDKKAFKKFLQELAFFDSEILTTSKAIKVQIRYLFSTNTNSISLNQAA